MVEILRKKFQWYNALHDILKCPVCSNCPNSNVWIYECSEGHIICQACKVEKQRCPTCNQDWSILRNRLAEDFCSKFQRIKDHLLNVLYVRDAENLFISELPAASTQTEEIIDSKNIEIEDTLNDNSRINVHANNIGAQAMLEPKDARRIQSAMYPCCIRHCKKHLAFSQLLNHITKEHSSKLKEIPLGSNRIFFHQMWGIPLVQLPNVDLVFRIPKVGVFLFKVYTNASDDLIGFISLIHNNSSKDCCHSQFSYELEFECCDKHKSRRYTGDVQAWEIWIENPEKKCLKVTNSLYNNHLPAVTKVCCRVVLTRKLCQGGQTSYKKKKTPPKPSKNH